MPSYLNNGIEQMKAAEHVVEALPEPNKQYAKEHILKMLKDQKTKRDLRQQLASIVVTFGPMIASTFALFIALLVLMAPNSPLPFSILIDLSILLILFALVTPIELFVEDLLIIILSRRKRESSPCCRD